MGKKEKRGQLSRDNELLQGKGSRGRKQQWSSELLPQQQRTWSEDMTTLVRQSGSGSPCWSKHKLLGGPIDKTFSTFLSSQPICDKPWSVAVGSLIKTIQTMDMQLIMHIRVPRTRRKLMTLSRIVPSGRTTIASCRVKKRALGCSESPGERMKYFSFFLFLPKLVVDESACEDSWAGRAGRRMRCEKHDSAGVLTSFWDIDGTGGEEFLRHDLMEVLKCSREFRQKTKAIFLFTSIDWRAKP